MLGKIIGGYTFKSKNGNDLTSLTIQDTERTNAVGICCVNRIAKDLPASLSDMLNKTFVIDCQDNFASGFYEVKK